MYLLFVYFSIFDMLKYISIKLKKMILILFKDNYYKWNE